jgi:hypothetical protein
MYFNPFFVTSKNMTVLNFLLLCSQPFGFRGMSFLHLMFYEFSIIWSVYSGLSMIQSLLKSLFFYSHSKVCILNQESLNLSFIIILLYICFFVINFKLCQILAYYFSVTFFYKLLIHLYLFFLRLKKIKIIKILNLVNYEYWKFGGIQYNIISSFFFLKLYAP